MALAIITGHYNVFLPIPTYIIFSYGIIYEVQVTGEKHTYLKRKYYFWSSANRIGQQNKYNSKDNYPNNDITVKWWYSNYYLNFHEDRMRNSFVWLRFFGATLKLITALSSYALVHCNIGVIVQRSSKTHNIITIIIKRTLQLTSHSRFSSSRHKKYIYDKSFKLIPFTSKCDTSLCYKYVVVKKKSILSKYSRTSLMVE